MIQENALFRTYFDREKNALISRGNAKPIARDLEFHLLSIGADCDPGTLKLLKDGLAAMALYLVSRPRFESFGWTVSLQDPAINFFFGGSAREYTVVGRAFLEGVRAADSNRFFAQIARPFGDIHTSSVDVEGRDIFGIVEQYCRNSDQQLVRFFHSEGDEEALLTALPDVDRAWFESVDGEALQVRTGSPGVSLISERQVSLRCGCDAGRISRVLAELYKEEPEELFRGDPSVEVECPRCGTKHLILREAFEKALRKR